MIDLNTIWGNQVFWGMIGAGAVAAVTYSGKSLLLWAWKKVKRTFSSTITLNSEDSLFYPDVCDYVFSLKSFRNIKTLNISGGRNRAIINNKLLDPEMTISPESGLYFGRMGWRLIWVWTWTQDKMTGGKTYFLMAGALALGNSFWKEKLDKIVQDKKKSDSIEIRTGDRAPVSHKKRGLDSVFLEGGIKEELVSIIEKFHASEELYNKHGIPYGLNFLFHGKSGTGKTSLIFALASHFGKSILTIPSSFTEDQLLYALECANENQVIVIEDVDVGGVSIDREKESKISLSTLLNVLDGFQRVHGSIVFLTTNKFEKLDSALVRPGRINKICHLNYYSREFAEKISLQLTGKVVELEGEEICPADLINKIHLESL